MSITTYAELQTAVADWLLRTDLTSITPDFITLAEADMQRKLRTYQMETRLSVSYDEQFEDLPADWLETVSLYLSDATGPHQVDLISRAEMLERRYNTADTGGLPKFYAVAGTQIELFPTPDEAYSGELLYIQKIPVLSVSNTTNWLLTAAPDAYLYGALLQSAPYLKDDERVPMWATAYDNALTSLQLASDRSKSSGSGLRMKIRGLS